VSGCFTEANDQDTISQNLNIVWCQLHLCFHFENRIDFFVKILTKEGGEDQDNKPKESSEKNDTAAGKPLLGATKQKAQSSDQQELREWEDQENLLLDSWLIV
jgi:hypothetical protein